MGDALRRATSLAGLASAAAVVLAGPGAAPAGVGTPPPLRPGQPIARYYPRTTSAYPSAAARDSDGRVVVAGQLQVSAALGTVVRVGAALGRFTAAGAPDASFGSGGGVASFAAGASEQAHAVTPLADGKLLVGGASAANGVARGFVERYAADGSLDRSFGDDGIAVGPEQPAGSYPRTLAVTPLADGTIVAVEEASQPTLAADSALQPGGLAIVRFGRDGARLSVATSTAPDWSIAAYTAYPSWSAAHVFPDGSVLVAGSVAVPIELPCPCEIHVELVLRKFRPDGSVDESFGAGGRVTTRIGADTYGSAMAVTGDGSIVVVGASGSAGGAFVAARYRSDGSLDTSFGDGGTASVEGGNGDAVAVAADGSVFLGGLRSADLVVVKLDRGGVPVAGFGSGGVATSSGKGQVVALFPDRDGGVTAVVGHGGEFGLARYTAAGVLDTGLGSPSISLGLPPAGAFAVAATPTGAVAAAGFGEDADGRTGMRVALVDQTRSGKPFGGDGEVTLLVGDSARATAVAFDAAGRIVAGGDSTSGGARRWIVARFGRDGTLDSGFGASGIVRSSETGAADGVLGLVALPDSRLLLLVRQGGRELLVRLAADGMLDRTFGENGDVSVPIAGGAALAALPDGGAVVAGAGLACAWIDDRGVVTGRTGTALPDAAAAGVAVQHDGEIVVAGTTPDGIAVVRRRPDGTLDSAFGTGGIASHPGLDAAGVAVQRDGRIAVAVRPRDGSSVAAARFLYTGRVDAAFGDDGLAAFEGGGGSHGIAIVPGGIVVAGTVPAPRQPDFALVTLYQGSLVSPVTGTLFHVTPRGVPRRVVRGAQPAWSTAARELAYVSDDAGAPAIAVRRGRATRRIVDSPLATGAVVIGAPQWSPDGKLLAVQMADGDGSLSVGVVRPSGGAVRRIDAATSAARWLSGGRLVYVSAGEIRVADVDTGAVRRVTTGWDVRPAPRGGLLAVANIGWSLVRPDGAVVRRLPRSVVDVSWAPDGRHLAAFDRRHLVVLDLKGHERRLAAPAGAEARTLSWSPDGRLIAFVNRIGDYSVDFVDVRSGRRVGRWIVPGGFARADPSWDANGVYVTTR